MENRKAYYIKRIEKILNSEKLTAQQRRTLVMHAAAEEAKFCPNCGKELKTE